MKLFIAAGTSEGKELSGFCERHKIDTVLSVATEYGEELIPKGDFIKIRCGRMDAQAMEECLTNGKFTIAVDATHPYAVEVTANLKRACEKAGIPYLRLLRERQDKQDGCIYTASIEEAAEYLRSREGNILLTTGSKEMKAFGAIADKNRLFARVLPDADSLSACEAAGIPRQNRIGMQGPFTKDLNKAMISQIQAKYVVTKDTGKAGGFQAKIDACLETGALAVVVERPAEQDTGETLAEIEKVLLRLLQEETQPEGRSATAGREPGLPDGLAAIDSDGWGQAVGRTEVIIAGIGPGCQEQITVGALEAIRSADICIGAERMLDLARKEGKEVFAEYRSKEIAEFLRTHSEYQRAVILVSGDTGFFSASKKLISDLRSWNPKVLPGISSLAYFCGRLGIGWEDVMLCSHHGIEVSLVDRIRENQKVFSLFGKGAEIHKVCAVLCGYGMNQVHVSVGERLSYPDERLIQGTPEEICREEIGDLSVAVFENPEALEGGYPFGIPDDAFIRGRVPMTKEEVRTVSLSKLKLHKNSIVYDIGAGTGSVSIEAALACSEGSVYAVEKNPEALELICKNIKKFRLSNIKTVCGLAPEALRDLPRPTHAFIGGSSGGLEEILELLFEKNPGIRLVLNAVSLETIARITELAGRRQLLLEAVSVQVSRSRKAGNYHLMQGENPIMIISVFPKQDGFV